MSKYLFVAGHLDDSELCCGATINKLHQDGHKIAILIFSRNYHDVGDLYPEFHNSMCTICPEVNSQVFDFPVRNFPEHRQAILDQLLTTSAGIEPDFIFTHSANDLHADHKTVGEESLRAFKKQNLITYCAEWNEQSSQSNYYIEVSEENMAKKLEAMACYKSQQHRHYFNREFTYARALLAGAKIGTKYAESFRILNLKG